MPDAQPNYLADRIATTVRLNSGECRRLRRPFVGESVGRVFVSINLFVGTNQISACEYGRTGATNSGLPGAETTLTSFPWVAGRGMARLEVLNATGPLMRGALEFFAI